MNRKKIQNTFLSETEKLLFFLLNAVCLAEKQQIPILVFDLTRSGLKWFNPQSTSLKASN
jgi:hypothetical protein